MQPLINEVEFLTNDPWSLHSEASDSTVAECSIVSVDKLLELLKSESDLPDHIGVVIRENESTDSILSSLDRLKLIAFEFGKFADGRAYTQARQLRLFYNYTADIRAMGDFMPDQMNYLKRVGFTSFLCRNDADAQTGLSVHSVFTETYQADAKTNEPLQQRR